MQVDFRLFGEKVVIPHRLGVISAPMADDNRISATSKRGGAIVATLSIVFLLYDSGWATIGEEIRLPILNVSVAADKATKSIYFASVVLFINWAIKLVIDGSFPGDRRHDRARDLSNDIREFEEREERSAERCVQMEEKLFDYLAATGAVSTARRRHPRRKDGFDIQEMEVGASGEANEMFDLLQQARELNSEFANYRKTYEVATKNAERSDWASAIQSYASYVAFPTAIFGTAFIEGIDNWTALF